MCWVNVFGGGGFIGQSGTPSTCPPVPECAVTSQGKLSTFHQNLFFKEPVMIQDVKLKINILKTSLDLLSTKIEFSIVAKPLSNYFIISLKL